MDKHAMQRVEDVDANPRNFGAARYPEVDPKERARAERSAETYGSGYLVLVDGEWRSFCGEEVKIIKPGEAD
jgi:hypothetical protein